MRNLSFSFRTRTGTNSTVVQRNGQNSSIKYDALPVEAGWPTDQRAQELPGEELERRRVASGEAVDYVFIYKNGVNVFPLCLINKSSKTKNKS